MIWISSLAAAVMVIAAVVWYINGIHKAENNFLAMGQSAAYGTKVPFAQNRPIQFPDFLLQYIGSNDVPGPNNAKWSMTFYNFTISSGTEQNKISYSSGSGVVFPNPFSFHGAKYTIEMYYSAALGKLAGNELVITKTANPGNLKQGTSTPAIGSIKLILNDTSSCRVSTTSSSVKILIPNNETTLLFLKPFNDSLGQINFKKIVATRGGNVLWELTSNNGEAFISPQTDGMDCSPDGNYLVAYETINIGEPTEKQVFNVINTQTGEFVAITSDKAGNYPVYDCSGWESGSPHTPIIGKQEGFVQ
jgi:hypothetical protein